MTTGIVKPRDLPGLLRNILERLRRQEMHRHDPMELAAGATGPAGAAGAPGAPGATGATGPSGIPLFANPVESQFGEVLAQGVLPDAARADHVHDRHDDAIHHFSLVNK